MTGNRNSLSAKSSQSAFQSCVVLKRRLRRCSQRLLYLAGFCLLPFAFCVAQDDLKERRVFVPVEDLDTVIAKDQRGVLLPRDEFLKLYRDAQKNAPVKTTAPVGAVISGATYSAKFDGEQLVVQATIKIRQFADSWQALPLPFGAMAVENAKLNGQPAKLGRNEQTLFLLSDARGEHTLTLELSTPLSAVGADKVASIGVLPGIAGTLKIAVPAGKHLQLDGLSIERPAANDQPANYELAVGGKRNAVAIQLTDRQRERATDSLLFATTGFGLRVAPGEITWHAVTALQVHGTPLDRLVCVVPKTLEITDVDSNGLEAWELSDHPDDANSTRITLNYRQPFDGSRRIDFRGVMAVPAGESWRVPTLKINQVTSHIGRALVQHAPAVRLRTVESVGVRTATVSDADLKSIGTAGATDAGQVALLFDVWKEDFSLGFVAQPKEQDVQASISSIFDLTATGLDLITAATMETSFAPLFELEVALPAEWLLTAVSVNGQPLPWQVRTKEDEPGINHIRIPLPQPLRPGQQAKLEVRAHRDPDGWPVEDQPVDVTLPELRLPQSSVSEGTYVIKADADLDVVPGDINGLDPTNVPVPGTRLGFAYQDTRFGGTLKIERKPSRVAARTLTFARLDKQTLHAHFESELTITGGGLRVLEVSLAESAGKDLRFQLASGAARIVEQTSRPGENGELIWTLHLDRHLVGTATLVVTSVAAREQLKVAESLRDSNAVPVAERPVYFGIPHLRIVQADRQNGFISIEAEGDQRLTITAQDGNKANLPEVDPIDLPAPQAYAPSQRIVAAYRYFAGTPNISIADERFDRLPVPTAICRIASINSVLSPAGEFQHQATFHFTAVGVQSLRIKFDTATSPLPLGEGGRRPGEGTERSTNLTKTADSATESQTASGSLTPARSQGERGPDRRQSADLWAALVDGHPVEVRRADGAFLIPLRPSDDPAAERSLQLFYRTNVPALRGTGELRQPPPELTVLNGAGVSQPMQVLDQQWELRYPPDLLLTDSQGVFVPDPATPLDRSDWLSNLPKSLSLPSVRNIGRMVSALVLVLAIVAVIWSRFRWGWKRGVVASIVLLGIGSFQWFTVASRIQTALDASHPKSSAVSGWFGQEQQNATYFGEAAQSLDGVAEAVDAPMAAPHAMTPMAAEPNVPKPADESLLELQKELTKKLAEEAEGLKRADKSVKRGFAMKTKDGRELRDQVSDSKAEDFARDNGISFRQGSPGQLPSPKYMNDDVQYVPPGPSRAGSSERGGLLSLTMAMESQDGAATKKFRYLGTETAASGIGLDLVYENRATGWTGRGVWIAALAFLAWVLPPNRRTFKASWAALGLTLPLALSAIVPLAWQNTLDGIFFGTVAAIALWTLRAAGESLANAWPRMKTKSFWTRSLTRRTASLCLFAFFAANSAFAQAPQVQRPAVAPPVNPNPDIPARPTIIFPFDDAKDPLAAERVYLPHAKFVELWNAAHPESRVAPPAPQDGLVAEALVVVAPNKKVDGADATAKVTARITLFSFRKQQIVLPIPLRLASLSEAKLDDAPAALVVRDENGTTRLHVVIDKPGLHVLDLTAEVPVNQQGPSGQLVIGVDPLPSGKLLFVPPAEDVTFRVNGASNLFRMRNGTVAGEGEKKNYFEVPISAGGDVRFAWQPKQAAGAVDAIVQSDSATAVGVEDAGIRISSGWSFKVPRGAINDLSFSLPKELKVRSISGPDVGGWELGENVDGRALRVFLRRAVSDQTSLAFELFLETRVADEAVLIQVPVFAPLQVSRDFGVIGLFAAPQFSLKNIATKGLTQINANQFAPPVNLTSVTSAPLSAFRYTARPFEVSFSAQRRAPESTGFAEHALIVERRKVRMSSRLRWELAGALRSSVSVQLPPMWLPVDVDATALQDWHIDPTTNVLTVEFTEPRIGAVELVLQGNVAKEPEDAIAEITAPTPLELSKLVTQAAVWFDPAYQATVSSSNTWKTSDPEHCSEELRNKLSRPAKFVFSSNVVMPEVLGFDLARAVPKLSADAVSLVTVTDTAVDYSLALQWKISEAASDTFTFTTPDWLAGKLDFQGAAIRQTSFASAGEGSGHTRWTVTLQDPIGSRYFLLATATLPPPAEKREVTTPTITFERHVAAEGDDTAVAPADGQEASPFSPLETQRQYVVVINLSGNQLTPIGAVGESVQRDELPIVVDQHLVDQATAVLRIRGQKSDVGDQNAEVAAPKWSLKSFAAQAGAAASVNLADLTTVLAADGTWRMQCVYTIKNRSRQFLALQLPAKSQALSVFVADQPSRLVELKKDGKIYQLIALPKTSEADLSFQVKLVLSGRLATGSLPRGLKVWSDEIELPTPSVVSLSDDKEFGIPVARTLWAVHVPQEWSAKPINDPLRHNLSPQAADTADVAYRSTWLQEANELMRVIEGNNPSSQKMQARNNLKQIGLALHNYDNRSGIGPSAVPQSEDGRKLAESVKEFDAKCADLESRIILDTTDSGLNFYVAKDQQQAAQAHAAQRQAQKNANGRLFFGQGGQQGGGFQRQVITDNNDALFFGNSGFITNGEDRNGNGILDPGEDTDGDGVLNLNVGSVRDLVLGANVNGTSPDLGLKFKLNVESDAQPAAQTAKPGQPVGGKEVTRQSATGKGVSEVERASRRKQAVDQLGELNKAVDNEKFAQQQVQQFTNQQPQSRSSGVSNSTLDVAPEQPNAAGVNGVAAGSTGSGPSGGQFGTDWSDLSNRRRNRYGMPPGGGQQGGGGGLGGGGRASDPAIQRGRLSFGVGVNSNSGDAGTLVMSDGTVRSSTVQVGRRPGVNNLNGVQDPTVLYTQVYEVDDLVLTQQGWTQAGGSSLPIEILPNSKDEKLGMTVLRFSRASGSPRLALSVRPNESDKLGLGLVWAAVWASIAIWLLRLIAGSSSGSSSGSTCRQATARLSALGLLGMFFLPSPLSELCFLVFALAAIVLAIGALRSRRQNAAAS